MEPSKRIRPGYESASILDLDGRTYSGVLVEANDQELVIADPANDGKQRHIALADVDQWRKTDTSTMPDGLVNLLEGKAEFLDLAAYLIAVAEGGPKTALELRPPPSMYELAPVPEYEARIDHAGLLKSLDRNSFRRGRDIYELRCINCHGTIEAEGSLPTSLRFAEGKFKNGADPYSMYRTLTHGYGMMVRQPWLVPQQKYDVIHYIREHFLRSHNPSQYVAITPEYLAGLPAGDSRGPKPVEDKPWTAMDYGPVLSSTLEVGTDASDFAYKGIAVRLDPGPGGVAQGSHWILYDHDTMRVAAIWSASGPDRFIDWRCIHFDGRHNEHPHIAGTVQVHNPTGPGWARPGVSDDFVDDQRVLGRDNRRYGPLPRDWAQFKGRYDYGNKTVLHYTVGGTDVWEMPGLQFVDSSPVFTRSFQVGPHSQNLTLQVACEPGAQPMAKEGSDTQTIDDRQVSLVQPDRQMKIVATDDADSTIAFDGTRYAQVDDVDDFDLNSRDYTITAAINTKMVERSFAKPNRRNSGFPTARRFSFAAASCVSTWVGSAS